MIKTVYAFNKRLAVSFIRYRAGGHMARARWFRFRLEQDDLFVALTVRVWRFEVYVSCER